MTVNTLTSSAEFETDGANRFFPFTFKFLDSKDLVVAYIDAEGIATPLTLNVDYTVSGEGSEAGGQVITTLAPANLGRLVITREMKASQLTSLRNQGRFFAEVHETVFDRLTMLLQQALAQGARALRTSMLEPAGISSLPLMIRRANRLLAFDSSGNPVESNLTLEQLEQQPALALAAAKASAEAAVASGASAEAALTSAVNSSNSATLSQMWASNPEDTPVVAGLYSAFHWSRKALASAQAAAATLAGAVMKTGAQTMAGPLTVTNGFVGIPLSKEYTSPKQIITVAGALTLAHGLGGSGPKAYQQFLVCEEAELGYSVGDIVGVPLAPDRIYSCGVSITSDSANIVCRYGSLASVFFLLHKTTGSVSDITPSKWRFLVRAWA